MIKIIDTNDIKKEHPGITHWEIFEFFLNEVKEYEKKVKNPKRIMGIGLASALEPRDYGTDLTYYDLGMKSPPRCEKGYYADFWVSTSLQNHALIIAHDDGFDSFELLNSPNEVCSQPQETSEDQ